MRINRGLSIGERWLQERFVRSSGPGGQNVNRVATAVQLRFDLAACPDLEDEVKKRLGRIAGNRLGADGTLLIDARRFRTQQANRRDARKRLRELVLQALVPPGKRRPTRPNVSAIRRRLEEKRRRKKVKQERRSIIPSEWE